MSTGGYPDGMSQYDHDKEFDSAPLCIYGNCTDGKCPDCQADLGDYLYEMEKDRQLWEEDDET